MKYCKTSTENHPLSIGYLNQIEKINTIIAREGSNVLPFEDEVGVNLDLIKNSYFDTYKIKRPCSMDMIIVLRDDDDNKSTLLVEFKFDCKKPSNLETKELRCKIIDSIVMLFGSGIPIYNKHIFIFKAEILQEARRVITQKLINPSADVLDINDFQNIYF